MDDMEESEVDEADGRGESIGDTLAVEGDDASESTVVDVVVRLRTGFTAPFRLDVVEAIASFARGRRRWRQHTGPSDASKKLLVQEPSARLRMHQLSSAAPTRKSLAT
jgi:hypothetical protein